MRRMLVQSGTCLVALAVLVSSEALIVQNLISRSREIDQEVVRLHAQYPQGMPSPTQLRHEVDDLDRELGEQLYPQLHDLTAHLAEVQVSQQGNARNIRALEGRLAEADAQENAPPASFLGNTLAWLNELINDITQIRQDLQAARQADGRFNQELVRAGWALAAVRESIDADLHRRDFGSTLLQDAHAYAALHQAYLGAGRTALILEHLALFVLLAGLTVRYCFRLLILLEIPGEVRLG